MPVSPLSFASLLDGLKAAGEDTRLRLLALLGEGELTVSELTEILGQSQPRISRHLKLLAEAGLVERFREASWVFYRRATDTPGAALTDALLALMAPDDDILLRDHERLEAVRAARAAHAQAYFRAHAHEWDALRRLHAPDEQVEDAILDALQGVEISSLLDLGTGTGRILELFAPRIERGVGIDLSADMLTVARANLERAGARNCTVRQGDIYSLALPRDAFDVVVVHQVLHFLEDAPRALKEAARVLRPGGRLLVVDFAPHDLEFLREAHAHRRLGFAPEVVEHWLAGAGLLPLSHRPLAPQADGKLTVSLWLARDPRAGQPVGDPVEKAHKEVA
ncbi:ubiquinone/menaquinone biosynthesis C-methylase UbiE/DNA-binding HxlR family transcriptional regulator [Ancylobacter sp. 3268]|uniref:ArsR/SmtB family transcription factor n=1 Tax=Ancylobacter sp. 3268 TaxID=2817752 RepID=UPI00285D75F9|nr:metalloregulator ArsR/SmtB family transcription factor [Ancylobacter sp. 3268]MDR6954670.1 ubiquinone/menaquinone biosynthesis C-methylase UbiE/DNA-binding HxlR family transcriptional regulator [Ancylobacter sp. 3268]